MKCENFLFNARMASSGAIIGYSIARTIFGMDISDAAATHACYIGAIVALWATRSNVRAGGELPSARIG